MLITWKFSKQNANVYTRKSYSMQLLTSFAVAVFVHDYSQFYVKYFQLSQITQSSCKLLDAPFVLRRFQSRALRVH